MLLGGSMTIFAADSVPAAKMLPESTQAFVSLPNTPNFIERWNKTQLGKLALDDQLMKFWNTQREELQSRFSDAGWQLNLQVEDLQDLSAGQTSIGWIGRTGEKAYSMALIIDLGERTSAGEKFLKRVEDQLKERKATVKNWKHGDVNVVQYSVPSPSNPARLLESNYAISKGQLIATDDSSTMNELLDAQAGDKKDSLYNSSVYKDALSKVQGNGTIAAEYFVRPLGIAKLLRVIGAKAPKGNPDLLKILEDQGFGALQFVAGNIELSEEGFDVFHNGFVKLQKPAKEAVKILDFPNVPAIAPPVWLSKESASVLGFSWSLKDAFNRFESLVDAYVGEGTFQGMLEGIRDEPNGPQIDIVKEVLPLLGTEMFIVTEIKKPITPDSKRSLVLVKLNDNAGKMKGILDRYGKAESNGTPLDYEGYRIWSFKNEEEELKVDFGTGGNKVDFGNESEEDESDKPLLDHWAIGLVEGFFVFSSDAELIKETIERIKVTKNSAFAEETDVKRAKAVIDSISGGNPHSVMQIDRADRSFEMQYELFREGKLNASKSILAAILDRLLDPKHQNRGQEQKLKGDTLPPFQQISSYFQPSGSIISTEEDGWAIQSFVLGKD